MNFEEVPPYAFTSDTEWQINAVFAFWLIFKAGKTSEALIKSDKKKNLLLFYFIHV